MVGRDPQLFVAPAKPVGLCPRACLLPSRATRCAARLAGATAAVGLAVAAHAQTPPLPSTIEPGRIQERVEPPRAPLRTLELPEMRQGAPGAVPEAVRSARVVIREVRFAGASAVPVARLQAEAAPFVDRQISGADIFELARRLTAVYREAGFLLSQVVVPPQTLADGVLTLRVVEGYIAAVRIEGDPSVAATLAAIGEKIKGSRPLHAADLERYLLIANDLPGVQLRSVLSPSQTPGAADLTLIAAVRSAEGFAALDNYGSRYLGPGQASVGVTGNQWLGADDQWRLVGVTTGANRELAFGQLAYAQVLNVEGLKLALSVSQARTRPGDILTPFDVRGRADSAAASLGYPVLRARNQSVAVRGVYDHRDVQTDMLGTRVVEDRIRAVRAGVTWTLFDRRNARHALDVEISKGVGGTGRDDRLKSRLGADGGFGKVAFDYELVQPLGASYLVAAGLGGQWTDQPLLSSEQFALGGRRFGRAYEPAELVGDRALALRLEPAYIERGDGRWSGAWFAFYDVGRTWTRSATAGDADTIRSLASAGLGTRVSLGRHFSATLEAAWPLTRPSAGDRENGKRARALGSLQARF